MRCLASKSNPRARTPGPHRANRPFGAGKICGIEECPPPARKLEADQDGFEHELHAPDLVDALLDFVFQGKDFSGGGSAAIHDG